MYLFYIIVTTKYIFYGIIKAAGKLDLSWHGDLQLIIY